jgi:hypothetical protein
VETASPALESAARELGLDVVVLPRMSHTP